MNPQIFGWEHFTYLAIFIILTVTGVIFAKKYAKSEKSQNIILKTIATILLLAIVTNRLSIVFKSGTADWKQIIPDSYCGMSSLVLSLAVLVGKKNNNVLHFVWFMALLGGVITMIYPDFIGQSTSVFYLPTISGLLHHSISIALVVLLFLFNQIHITYKKWYCTVFGFTSYITLGAFLIGALGKSDAFHIIEPLLEGTPLTAWGVMPIYIVLYGLTILAFEMVRKYSKRHLNKNTQTK